MTITGMSPNALMQPLELNRNTAGGKQPDSIREAAEAFESLFVNMLIKNMRQANEVLAGESLMVGRDEKFYRTLLDQQLATVMTSEGRLGLSDAIVRQLGGTTEGAPGGADK